MLEKCGVVLLGGAHGALALARSLGACGVPVAHITHDSSLAGWSRHVKKPIHWPGPEDANAVSFLLHLAQDNNWDKPVLVPGGDAEVELVSRHIAQLDAAYKMVLPDWDVLHWLCKKPLLYKRGAELGLATPHIYQLGPNADLDVAAIAFPVVLKPHTAGRDTQISKARIIKIDDQATFAHAFREAAGQIGAENLVVQELIPGGGESQFSYAALWDNGKPAAEFTARRVRQYPVEVGHTSTFVQVCDEPEIVEAARTLLGSVGYSGLVEIEFKRDHRDGTLKLMDVHPRPWSWFGLCSAAGSDLGMMLWRQAHDQCNRPAVAQPGVAWMYLPTDALAAVSLMARRHIGLGDYLGSFGHVKSWATFASNDPLPGLLDLPLAAWRVLRRRLFGRDNLSGFGTSGSIPAPGATVRASPKGWLKFGLVRAGLETMGLPGIRSLAPSVAGRGVIFTMHHVRPAGQSAEASPNALLSITPEFLEQVIATTLEAGLTPVHLHQLPQLLADPTDSRRFVAFTLDDGYRNNAEFAAPVFKAHGVPYTIFVNSGFVERTRTIWWETVEAMVRNAKTIRFDFGNGEERLLSTTGAQKFAAFDRFATFVQSIDEDEAIERIDAAARNQHAIDPMAIVDELIMDETELRQLAADPLVHFGAHTVSHVNLRRVSQQRLHDEIEQSASAIERYVDERPRSFAYPYGWTAAVGEREARAVAAAGFAIAVTTQPGVLSPSCLERPTQMPRVSLNGHFQKKRYVRALISGLPFKLANHMPSTTRPFTWRRGDS